MDIEEIENAKQCLNETIENTYAEGKANKLISLKQYIAELEKQKEAEIYKINKDIKEMQEEIDGISVCVEVSLEPMTNFKRCRIQELEIKIKYAQEILNLLEGEKE